MNYTVEPEIIASILVAILIGNALLERGPVSAKARAFRVSLGITFLSIMVNIFSIYAIAWADALPYALVWWMNFSYFLLTPMMVTSIATASVAAMFDGRYSEKGLKLYARLLGIVYMLYLPVIFGNIWTGWLFSFDANLNYIRGPLNQSGGVYLGVTLVILLVCYFKQRKKLVRTFKVIVATVVVTAAVFAVFQLAKPNTILTGTIAAVCLLVLFIYGQRQQVQMDHLTGLSNREVFYDALENFAYREVRFHAIIISLRNYKEVNNRFGQRIGDFFLREISCYLASLDKNAVVCRFSGVEFALIVPTLSDSDYETMFTGIERRFHQPWQAADKEIALQAVIADAAYPEHARSVNELVAALEYAVRIAKSADDGKPVRFNKQLRNELGRRNFVISQLEPALVQDRFELYFQPVFDLRCRRFTGAEVLLRLKDELGQTISPSEFIPLAEEAGLLSRLNWYVMDHACTFLARHLDCGIEWLSVNVSAQDFEHRDTAQRLKDLLADHGVAPSMIKLEITEGMLIRDFDGARARMRDMQQEGIGVCLDDFGTGYSNLYNVMSLPFDFIKVDKQFVERAADDRQAKALLETVIRWIRAAQAQVLVEGVETAEQDQVMRSLGVDCIQGFLYARPIDGAAFAAFMAEGLLHAPGDPPASL